MSILNSSWSDTPIDLNYPLSHPAWAGAASRQIAIPRGFMWAKNDAQFVYIALDLVGDTKNDPGTGDYFWLTFDTDRNGAITPNVDLNYALYPGQPNKMGRQYYLGANTWTGLLNEVSSSECRIAFDASPNSATPHRIWKIRIRLPEIKVSLMGAWRGTPFIKFGLRVASSNPAFTEDSPPQFSASFARLHTLNFSRKAVIPAADMGPVMGSVGLIPTTKINESTGKATTDAGYYFRAQNHAFGGVLNIIGNRTQLLALNAAGATKYTVKKAEGAGPFSIFRSAWYNYVWQGDEYVLQPYSADSSGCYTLPKPDVDYSIDDLLIQFDTRTLTTGIHKFSIEFFNDAGLPVKTLAQVLTLYIDNNVPQAKINAVKHNGDSIPTCAIVQMSGPADGLVVDYDARDPEGNLLAYTLTATWGEGSSVRIEGAEYVLGMGPSWTGVANHNSALFVPSVTCAHTFTVGVWARTTNGYETIGYNSASRAITIKK